MGWIIILLLGNADIRQIGTFQSEAACVQAALETKATTEEHARFVKVVGCYPLGVEGEETPGSVYMFSED